MEGRGDVRRPNECIINAFGLGLYVRDEGIIASGVGVPGCDISLWGGAVPVASPWGDECCEVSVILREGH